MIAFFRRHRSLAVLALGLALVGGLPPAADAVWWATLSDDVANWINDVLAVVDYYYQQAMYYYDMVTKVYTGQILGYNEGLNKIMTAVSKFGEAIDKWKTLYLQITHFEDDNSPFDPKDLRRRENWHKYFRYVDTNRGRAGDGPNWAREFDRFARKTDEYLGEIDNYWWGFWTDFDFEPCTKDEDDDNTCMAQGHIKHLVESRARVASTLTRTAQAGQVANNQRVQAKKLLEGWDAVERLEDEERQSAAAKLQLEATADTNMMLAEVLDQMATLNDNYNHERAEVLRREVEDQQAAEHFHRTFLRTLERWQTIAQDPAKTTGEHALFRY